VPLPSVSLEEAFRERPQGKHAQTRADEPRHGLGDSAKDPLSEEQWLAGI
jgi:hypothetical protein